ncbi:DsbA family protein [Candidatus Azambacteria bacterium]|nr:DsbA family protein [Candidatus Azambacteria bacterium]
MKNLIVFGLVIAIAVGAGYYFFFAPERPEAPEERSSSFPIDAIAENDTVKGARDAKTVLIEYSDFQCPACAAYQPLVKQLAQDFEGKIAVVYRHFPLPQHKHAKLAAYASEAAGKQGKFWEMHDMIFETQKEWSSKNDARDTFIGYAEKIGLDRAQFIADIDSQEISEKVDAQYKSGTRAKVNGTPTFYVNGEKLDTPRTYDDLKTVIEEAIAKAQ